MSFGDRFYGKSVDGRPNWRISVFKQKRTGVDGAKGTQWARSIQPKFPEISVQNSIDRFGPTWKVSKNLVHLLRWITCPGRTGLKFGWMDRAQDFSQPNYLLCFSWMVTFKLSFSTFNSKRTDGKLLSLEIYKSRNCSLVRCLKCMQLFTISFGSLNLTPIVEHFRSSHPQREHSYWQGVWVGKQLNLVSFQMPIFKIYHGSCMFVVVQTLCWRRCCLRSLSVHTNRTLG